MKNRYISSLLFIAIIASANSCRKKSPDPEFYIKCKVDGQEYLPNNCANCMVGKILGDTLLLMNANAESEALGIGVADYPFQSKTYVLDFHRGGNAYYNNSPLVNDIFKTDSTRAGQIQITTLDKANKIISGSFYFQAYNPVQNKSVNVTEGKFRVKYTTN